MREGTATGSVPAKEMVPSTGARSSCGRRASRAAPIVAGVPVLTGSTARSENTETRRVHGLRGCSPARSMVASMSTPRPTAAGSRSAVASPARRVTGRVDRAASSDASNDRASGWSIPPISTPATVTPRGTSVEENNRSPT